jgi:hypothetical protein
MLVENQSCLDADAATGLLSFTHRANPNVIGAASGDIVVSYSANDGWDWTSYLTLKQDATHANRYPSGVIYNPAGNTDPDGAYVVYCGPSHNAGAWDNTFVGSIKMDSTNVSNGGINSHGALIRMGLVEAAGDFHVMGSAYQSSPYSLDTAYMYNGTWNSTSNSVDWSVAKFKPTFVEEASSGDAFAYVWNFNSAWSNDGMTGYFWTVGRDSSNDTRSYQPIVWKSTDAGANWAKMPVFDFSTVTAITDELRPVGGASGITRPMFSSAMEGVVDANGDLHLVSLIKAASNNHDDSLGYSWFYASLDPAANPIMDVYMTATGWDAKLLGYIHTNDVGTDDSPYGSGSDAVGWDLRLQAGKTADETKIFASWAETDTTIAALAANGLPMNSYPNIFVYGYDITNGNVVMDQNLTAGTAYDGDNHFHYMSDLILMRGTEYIVPITTADIWTGGDPLSPVYHYYLWQGNTSIDQADLNVVDVAQNRPNPFTANTKVDIRLMNASNVTIEVVNMMGQKVYSFDYGQMNSGLHTLYIDGTSLTTGVYFYTVHAGNSSVTKKMVVE